MKKILKLIGKVALVDLIIVFILSSGLALNSTIKNQSFQCESEGKGEINVLESSSENKYVCEGSGAFMKNECCSLQGVIKEGVRGAILITILAGFIIYPYALANYIFIVLLIGFFYWRDFLNKKVSA